MIGHNASNAQIILASGSPRRQELLTQLGYSFRICVPSIEETKQPEELPVDYVTRLSLDKALAVLKRNDTPQSAGNMIVLGSDTIVVHENEVLEKPLDFADARRMLRRLSGSQHEVITAVSITTKNKCKSIVVKTNVWFKVLSELEIEQYWLSGEPQDKAGSYGIQGLGGRFVTRIEGSYHAVVGLPLFETDQLLQEFLSFDLLNN